MTAQLDHPMIQHDAQLDLWGTLEPVRSEHVPGIGRCLLTPGEGWRARYTGTRYGWQIDRRITWLEPHHVWRTPWADEPELVLEARAGWEGWEPELPYGVEHITDRDGAVAVLGQLVARHGDDPHWLDRYQSAYAAGA